MRFISTVPTSIEELRNKYHMTNMRPFAQMRQPSRFLLPTYPWTRGQMSKNLHAKGLSKPKYLLSKATSRKFSSACEGVHSCAGCGKVRKCAVRRLRWPTSSPTFVVAERALIAECLRAPLLLKCTVAMYYHVSACKYPGVQVVRLKQ